jgi:hypothetical protein
MKRKTRQNEDKQRKLKDEKAEENPEDCVEKDIMEDTKRSQKRRGLLEERFLCL